MIRKIGLLFIVLAIVLTVAVVNRPDTFSVERSITIAAPASVPFGLVNDFHHWKQWSPFEKLDPAMKREFTGAASGVGAGYSWSGNSEAGEGRMTITSSVPNERIAIDLHFLKPLEASNITEFSFAPAGDSVRVTWQMHGKNTLLGKAIDLVSSMDQLVGGQFQQGLADLKRVAEAGAAPAP